MLIGLTWRAAWIVAVAALATAVAGVAVSQGHGTRASASGVLRVDERVRPSNSLYVEGAVEYLRLRRTGAGEPLLEKRFEFGKIRLTRRLPAGSYRVTSWTRTCSGTCDRLDPPSYDCRRTIRVRAGRTLRVTVRSEVGKDCRVSIG